MHVEQCAGWYHGHYSPGLSRDRQPPNNLQTPCWICLKPSTDAAAIHGKLQVTRSTGSKDISLGEAGKLELSWILNGKFFVHVRFDDENP